MKSRSPGMIIHLRTGADLEDMGQKAHTIRFRCWFWDDADNLTYADHTELLDSLKTTDLLDFIHPKYGLLKGKIESIAVNHKMRSGLYQST